MHIAHNKQLYIENNIQYIAVKFDGKIGFLFEIKSRILINKEEI